MIWYGRGFLEASIGNVLRRLCSEKITIEVDPVRSGKSAKDLERNVDQLIYWCREFWNQIYSVRSECPHEMRRLFETIRKLVENRYRVTDTSLDNRELPWQSVSAFCFLRFIVPAILHPHLFGLCPGLPSVNVQRSLTLIAKVIQSLANLNATVQKEEFMRGVKDFLKESLHGMVDYILVVSTPAAHTSNTGMVSDRHDRLSIVNALRNRTASMTTLDREAIPVLPHLLDIPKNLAIIASAVIRNSRDFHSKSEASADPADRKLAEICSKCLEVEEQALQRVSQLAARISAPGPSVSDATPPSTPGSSFSPSSPPSPRQRRASKSIRPSTAPSPSDSDPVRRIISDAPSPSSPRIFSRHNEGSSPPSPRTDEGIESRRRRRTSHFRSTSSDSISYRVNDQPPTPAMPMELSPDVADESRRKRGLLSFLGR